MQDFRPLGARELVGFSWSLYKRRFGPLIAVCLVLVGIPSILQWLTGVGWLMTLALLLTELLATGAFIRIIASHCVDLPISAAESIRAAWSRFGRMLGTWLIFVLGVVAVATVMIMIGTVILVIVAPGMLEQMSDFAYDPFAVPPETLLPFLAWTFVMVLPAIALAVSWWAAPMAVMVEGSRPVAGLRRSWKLILPHFGRAVGVLLLSVAVIAPPMVVLYWLLPDYLAVLLGRLWSVPLAAVVGTVLYLDLRARSEDLTHQNLVRELTSAS